jgi:hypothetical protein
MVMMGGDTKVKRTKEPAGSKSRTLFAGSDGHNFYLQGGEEYLEVTANSVGQI